MSSAISPLVSSRVDSTRGLRPELDPPLNTEQSSPNVTRLGCTGASILRVGAGNSGACLDEIALVLLGRPDRSSRSE
ncbi:hypothetical protein Plhal304r1_c082g0166971 [Plasmopara halstedii]